MVDYRTVRQIDRYELKGTLGEGAMGKVFLAFDPKLHREVAIKVISEAAALNDKSRERFHREARAIATLHHSNIVEIYDYSGVDSKYLYLVMERLEGVDLFDLLEQQSYLPETIVAAIGHELCLALEHAHSASVIHRDLKPENVFIDYSGRVVLTDFGIARAFQEMNALGLNEWSPKTEVIGTPGFMSPEQMLNRTLGPRTDIFALGALMYNTLTGKMPFEAPNASLMFKHIASGKYPDPREFNPEVSQTMVNVLAACLQSKPKKRPRSMADVRLLLREVLIIAGTSDLRDDLRDFLRDSPGFRKQARARTVTYLLERLKIALKDKDKVTANELYARINQLDPNNSKVQSITGLFDASQLRQQKYGIQTRPAGKNDGAKLISRNTAIVLFVAFVAFFVFGFLLSFCGDAYLDDPENAVTPIISKKRPENDSVLHKHAPVKNKRATLQLKTVSGRLAKLYLNGKRVKDYAAGIELTSGKHEIRAHFKSRRVVQKTVQIKANQSGTLLLDARKRSISIQWQSP